MAAPIAVALAAVLEVINDEDDMLLMEHRITQVRNDELEMMMLMNKLPTKQKVKMKPFLMQNVPKYTLDEFYFYFRMTRSTVEKIVQEFLCFQSTKMPKGTPPLEMQYVVLLGLWTLESSEPFRQIGERFNVSTFIAGEVFGDFCNTLISCVPKYVTWPKRMEMKRIASSFEKTAGFPGVIGVIDTCHVFVKQPQTHLQPATFLNNKNGYSIKLMTVVDHAMLFRDIYVGCPGSFPDAQVFHNNPLSNTLSGNTLPNDHHVLGDSAFPLSNTLLVPFKDNDGHLTRKQQNFNEKLLATRLVVEQAFGLLKGKFRKIKERVDTDTELASLITTAACVVHNICIKENDWQDDDIYVSNETDSDDDAEQYELDIPGHLEGESKRIAIADHLRQ